MPARNSRKQYVEDGYYHIYNRGVEKRQIFMDQQDYGVFLSYLKEYLLPKDVKALMKRLADPNLPLKEKRKVLNQLKLNNFSEEITLLAYCLMPNHFHFFVKQKSAMSIDKFMNSLCTRYTMYFNRKYKRVGYLFQGEYKAVLVTAETQFLHLSRYIHKQALALSGETLESQPCSYSEYLGTRKTGWVHPEEVLAFFSKTNKNLSYEAFVKEEDDPDIIGDIVLDDDL
jgi:putative transposase